MHRHDDVLGRTRKPGAASQAAPAPALKLQRAIGNRAVGQVLARKPAPRKPRQTGLRRDEAIARYARKAVMFWQRNPDLGLHHFASFLGAAVNTELNLLGIPDVKVTVSRGSMSAAAEFLTDSWQMMLNPDEFHHRGDAVQTMGDLTDDEAAIIAMTVYHEARHGEQHYRIARLQAGEGKELGFEMEEGAAAAAVDAPLKARGADGLELREAREWRTDEIGEDATYREAVTWWLGELRRAAKMVRDVKADDAAEVRERIGNLLRGWRKSGGAADYIRSHLASAKARKASTIIKDITRTNAAFGAAEAAWKKLDEHSQPADFKPLAEALEELARANYQAYYDQPVEHDAWEAGDAVFEAFHKALKAAAAPAK